MRRFQFSLRALLILSAFIALTIGLFCETRVNRALRNENRSLREELGIPSSVEPLKLYVERASLAEIEDPHHWVWRIIVPEGTRYWVRLRTREIPITDSLPDEGDAAFQLSPGVAVLHAVATRAGESWTLSLEEKEKKATFAFDGSFLRNGGVFFYQRLAEAGVRPPETIALYKAYQTEESYGPEPYAKSGLLIWLQRARGGT